MPLPRRHWVTVIAVNAVGAALIFIGGAGSAAIQVLGLLLLFPGSLIAALLPLQKLWQPVLWRCCQTDPAGLSNALYLPVAVLTNLLALWAVKLYRTRREPTVLPKQ